MQRSLVLLSVALILPALALDAAAASPGLSAPKVTLAVAQQAPVWDPHGSPVIYPVAGSLTCGAAQATTPQYEVQLRVKDANLALVASIAPASFSFTFNPADCVLASANATRVFLANLTVSAQPMTEAFSRIPVSVNATVHLLSATDALAGADAMTNFTVGYNPSPTSRLVVTTPPSVQGLVGGSTTIPLRINNTANGVTVVDFAVLNASSTLVVPAIASITLARDAAAPFNVTVSSPSGCPTPSRTFTLRATGRSDHVQATQTASWTGNFAISCVVPQKKGVPGPEPMMVLTVLAALVGLRRR